MPDYADCLAAWLDVIGIEQPHVLGLSWGTSVALELYRRHPDVPASLILASAYAGWAGSLSRQEVDARLESVLATADLPREELLLGWPGLLTSGASPEVVDELISIWADNAGTIHPASYRATAFEGRSRPSRCAAPNRGPDGHHHCRWWVHHCAIL